MSPYYPSSGGYVTTGNKNNDMQFLNNTAVPMYIAESTPQNLVVTGPVQTRVIKILPGMLTPTVLFSTT
jgi:hypothetical protein